MPRAQKAPSVSDVQSTRDAEYSATYKTWFDSLPPSQRSRLKLKGLGLPDTSRSTQTKDTTTALNRAPSPSNPEDDPADNRKDGREDDGSNDADMTRRSPPTTGFLEAADVLASFCARIRSHPNPLLAFDAACFASGLMDLDGLSQTALAGRHGVTRAAFSKLVVAWSETFNLTPSRGMKSKAARKSYQKSRLNQISKQKTKTTHAH